MNIFCCWYIPLCHDLDLWLCDLDLWPWTFAAYHLWHDETLYEYQIWMQSNNLQQSYCDLSVWPDNLEHVLSVALSSEIIFTQFDLRQLIIAFFMLIRYVKQWSWPLTIDLESSWHIKHHVIKVCTKFERNGAIPAELLIILWIFERVMSHHDLDLWPLVPELLQHFGCHAFKLYTKFDQKWIIHFWVIDDLARFRVQF